VLGDRRARSRIAVCPRWATGAAHDADRELDHHLDHQLDHQLVALGGAALAGAGLVVTAGLRLGVIGSPALGLLGLDDDDQTVAWRRVVDYVHGRGALIIARLEVPPAPSAALTDAVQRAAFAGFDVILLDPCGDLPATEALPSAVAAARAMWRPGGWIAAAIHDRPATRAAVIGHAAQVVRAGADLLWVSAPSDSPQTHGARLPAAPLADRLRNELAVATAIESGDALLPDLEAAIAAGRTDLVVVDRLPDGARRAS
jgi:anthraniloyl-CoA monooxygenase